ncbi:MAG: TadE/TadG family type IV pilus assembly protein [Novosphingobium sp.]
MVIETAIVAPVLVLMSLGAYQVSGVVARQTELQSAAAEAAAIALASPPDTAAKQTVLKNVLMASTRLPTDKVAIAMRYRCGSAITLSTTACAAGQIQSSYVRIQLNDTYTPSWTHFGVGRPITYQVKRYVMLKQEEVH